MHVLRMTKIGLLNPKDSEPQKLLEDGPGTHPKDLEQMEAGGIEKSRKNGGDVGKINFLLIWTSPFPIYLFICFLFLFDKCLQLFNPVHTTFLIGFIVSFEMLNVMLFVPPRYAQLSNLEVMKFKTKELPTSLTKLKYLHAFCTMITIWLFVDAGIVYICHLTSSDNFLLVAGIGCLFATFVTYKIYRSLRNKNWLNGFDNFSIAFSMLIQAFACSNVILAFVPNSGGFPFLVFGSFLLLSTVANLRFLYNFENPPRTKCMLTLVHTRKFLGEWFQWIAIMNGVIWAALLLLILLPPPSPYTAPRSNCIQTVTSMLVAFCTTMPICYLIALLTSCIACCFKNS